MGHEVLFVTRAEAIALAIALVITGFDIPNPLASVWSDALVNITGQEP